MTWPLSTEQEALYAIELGYRAWTWAQDCNPYEMNSEEEIQDMIPATT